MFKPIVTFVLLSILPLLSSCAGTNQITRATSNPVELRAFVGIYQPFAHAGFYVEISEHNGELYAQGKNQDKAVLVRDSATSFYILNQLRIVFKLYKQDQIREFLLEQNGAEYLFTKREVLLNNRTNQTEFQNSYPSVFNGNGPHSKYDEIDYLSENEKAYKSYTIVSRGSDDIDRTLGYDYQEFMIKPDFAALQASRESSITWLGHASFLIKMPDGSSLLTDPVFDEFDGFIGSLSHLLFDEFERVAPSVVNEKDVDYVNAVLISHNHYDHLSLSTIKNLGNNIKYFVPLNVDDEFPNKFKKVFEMDWYTTNKLNQNLIHFVPAHHYSGRGIFDGNESLWGGWIIESKGKKIFFSGDTGYSPIFKDIANKYGEMDLCLMATVAYAFDGRDIHMAPEDALRAADQLGCKTFIPWGYGTWATGYEHVLEPLRRLKQAMAENNYNFELKILKMGETHISATQD